MCESYIKTDKNLKNDDNEEIQVSVLCLTYNHEKYIRQTLEGFVNQKTDFKFEVLIHDDASTDQTASIIAEYEEKYPDLIKPIYQTENQYSQGIKINRIYNYPRAKGKYFAYCEGDDYWCDEQKLQMQFNAMEENPECSICVHKVQGINEDGSKCNKVYPDDYYGFFQGGILIDQDMAEALWIKKAGYPFQTSSYFLRREAIKDFVMGTSDFPKYMTGDMAYIRMALSKGHVYYIDRIMSCRRFFSIGSYNSRKKKISEFERRALKINEAKGDLLYDEYSAERFHRMILKSVSDKVVQGGALDQCLMTEFLDDQNWKKSDVLSNCSTKSKRIYFFSFYAHPLYLLAVRIYNVLKYNKNITKVYNSFRNLYWRLKRRK